MSMYRLKHWIVAAGLAAILAPAAYAQKEAAAKGPSISKAVAKQVKTAQDAIKKEKWADCVAALQSTEAVADKPPYDVFAVAELLGFCAARNGDTAGAEAAFSKGLEAGFLDDANRLIRYKQLLQLNYNLKAYERAAGFGEQAIAAGNTEEPVALLTAQSYYLLNDFKRTTGFIDKWLAALQSRGEKPAEIALQLYVSSCSKLDDDTCILKALEKQLEFHPRPETPGNITLVLLRNASEGNTLNVFRYAFEAGGMRRGEDYTEMAQLSIEKGLPGEALAVVEAGVAANVFNTPALTDLSKRLLSSAKTQVDADKPVRQRFEELEKAGFGHLPICMAKTQYSFSTDPRLMGAPSGHVVDIREVRLSAGAEFVVVITGDIMTMPGLPRVPAANNIRLDAQGRVEGLF